MQSIVLELWIRGLHLISIMRSLTDGLGAPTNTVGGYGRTGSTFFFFLDPSSSSSSSSAGSSSSSSAISSPSESYFFCFSTTTTTSGSGGGGYNGANASSSASMYHKGNRRSGCSVADQRLTWPSIQRVAKYLFWSLLRETIWEISSAWANSKICN